MVEAQSQPSVTTFYVTDYTVLDLAPYLPLLEAVLADSETADAITIRAFSDSVGSNAENLAQTTQFANAVRDWFINRGVSADIIVAIGRGDEDLAVETADEVDQLLNRRVEIELVTSG